MSATEALRANLTAAGIDYGCLGDYNTRVTVCGLSWLVEDNLDGTLNATTCVCDATPDEVMQAITGHGTATMRTVCDDDGVGHSECGGCGRTVGEWFKFCPWCGCRFTTIERTYIP
jgi:bacterioferritin-associated ferredoxin